MRGVNCTNMDRKAGFLIMHAAQWAESMRLAVRHAMASQPVLIPVPVNQFYQQAGLPVVEAPLPTGLESAIVLGVGDPFVLLNAQLGPFAQRFALAHELIHYWYHQSILPYFPSPNHYQSPLDTEANAGAAELLLPYPWFMTTAHQVLGQPLRTLAAFTAFITSPEARRWANQARVTVPVLGYHLQDLGWAPLGKIGPTH